VLLFLLFQGLGMLRRLWFGGPKIVRRHEMKARPAQLLK
jgi:hypothetical protein